MPAKCFVGNATARYEARIMHLEDEGPVWEWEPACARHAEELAENGHDVRPADSITIQSPPSWADAGANVDGITIPAHAIRERPALGTSEAIAYYLCDDPDGPELTQQAAADLLGKARGTIKTQLGQARDKLDKEA